MADANQPGNAPQHMSSQVVPAGNQTNAAPNGGSIEKQMIELARREKEVRKMQESLKGAQPIEALKERAQKDLKGLLRDLGLEHLAPAEDPNDPVAAVRKQLEDMQKQNSDREQRENDERSFAALKAQLGEKKEDYELINLLGYENQVFDALKNYKSESGETPDAYFLAKQIEDTLFSQLSALKGSKKVSGLYNEQPAPPRHPLDSNTTLTSSDRTSSQPAQTSAPTVSRHQMIADAAKHIKFND